jgi:UTP-glucose-1-phosphate uridylyltransferase
LTFFGGSFCCADDPTSLWDIIETQINNNLRDARTGNFSFTDTLNELRKRSGLRGYLLDGERLDIGTLPHVLLQGDGVATKL